MKKFTIIFLSAVLIVSLAAVAGLAQSYGAGTGAGMGKSFQGHARGGMNGGQGLMGGLMGLDLTDAQRSQIAAILDEHREAMQADCDLTSGEMQSIRQELASLIDSESYDEAAARQLLTRKFEMNTEKQIERQKVHHQILWEVLTSEQRDTLANQRANAEAFGRGSRRGGGAGGAGACRF